MSYVDNKSWAQILWESFVASLRHTHADAVDMMPTWSKLDDETQLKWERKAQEIVGPIGEKHFPDDVEMQRTAFELGLSEPESIEYYEGLVRKDNQ